jgi:alkaline phosphatase D
MHPVSTRSKFLAINTHFKLLLSVLSLTFLVNCQNQTLSENSVSPYDFPYGYPGTDYPVAGGHKIYGHESGPNLGEPIFNGQVKRVAQHALFLIQTNRATEAIAYADEYQARQPGYMDHELHFMRAMAYSQLGQPDMALTSMRAAFDTREISPQRFIAGPRRMFTELYKHPDFQALLDNHKFDLVHGPMLGAMTDRSVSIWMRTVTETTVRVAVSVAEDMSDARIFGPVTSRSKDDYTVVVEITDLKPETHYYYNVLLGEEQHVVAESHQQFRTYPLQNQPASFHVVFGGCSGFVPFNERMWDTIRGYNPLAMLTLGDNVYIDDPESPDQQRLMYYQRQSRPEWRRLVGATPIYAIWDDHDFAKNDSWGGPEIDVPYWKPMVLDIFKQNWVNPSYGLPNRPGVWFDFHIADVHFILLDGRYYREHSNRFDDGGEPVENPSMLGPEQLAWLKSTLINSDATFKVLISSVPWNLDSKGGRGSFDTWNGYLQEHETILSWINEYSVNGVVLASSDRHRSDAWLIERDDSYNLYEFSSGQFTNQHTHNVLEGAIFGYNEKQSFGYLEFDTEAADPSVTYKIVNIDGQIMESLTVRLSQLMNP